MIRNRLFLIVFLALSFVSARAFGQATDSRVAAALRLVDLGNPREAADHLQPLVQQEPKNAEAHAALALAESDLGNLTDAMTQAQTAFDIDRHNVLVRIARGTVFGKQGQIPEALKDFNEALKQNDKEIGTYLAFAHYYMSIDSLKPAEILLYRAQAINGNDARTYLGLAELYEKQRIPDLAIAQYEQAVQHDPNDVVVHAKLAGLYLRTHKYNESAGEWLKIIRLDSNYADAYYQIGNLYFLARQPANAAYYAQKYAALRPNDIKGQWLLAQALTDNNQYKEALPALQAVSSNDSLRALSQLLLARSYFFSKDYDKALDIYKAAKTLDPLDRSNYAAILVMRGDTAGGIEQYKQSLVNDTIRSATEKRATQSAIVSLLYNTKHYEEAGAYFAEIAQSSPSVENYLFAGQAYSAAKKPDLATQYYQKALALDPSSLRVRFQMAYDALMTDPAAPASLEAFQGLQTAAQTAGRTDTAAIGQGFIGYHYAGTKDWDKAVEHLNTAVNALEGSKSPMLESFESVLGQSYLQIHENAKAKEWFDKVLALNPNNKSAKEGLEFIKQSGAAEKKSKKKSEE